jgi:hypothetical protein
MLQEATIAGVVVVGVEVESVEMMMAVEVVVVRQALMVTQMGGEVKAKKGSMVVETVTIGIRALEEGLQEIPVSLGSFLEISMQREVIQ